MINFHPSSEQLRAFATGDLAPALSIMVSAHCDMCPRCMDMVNNMTEELAQESLEEVAVPNAELLPSAMQSMLADITKLPSSLSADDLINIAQKKDHTNIELDGRKFQLPRTLHRYVNKTGNWSSLVGKLWQAPVDMGTQGVANFIFMGHGGSVPEHTHRGTEYTLVINGEFSDGLNQYDSGDFILMDSSHTHTPQATSHDGCLVFSMVDEPLHFTSGLARLLNPFSHLFFR